MAVEPGTRRILPQNAQMQTFSFAPPSVGPREGQKNYVFVDEHNRHKRLKVMRACEGCRRRKIKCDAATTNTWPCSACTRLKLHCVPPTVNQDDGFTSGQISDSERVGEYDASSGSDLDNFHQRIPLEHPRMAPELQYFGVSAPPPTDPTGSYSSGIGVYQMGSSMTQPEDQHNLLTYHDVPSTHIPVVDVSYHHSQPMFPTQPAQGMSSTGNGSFFDQDQTAAKDLSDALGELKIDETGVAPYIRQQKVNMPEPEGPLQEESEVKLPPLSTGAGSHVRIPPELMPAHEEAMQYFKVFFTDIHPYVPVIIRSQFYRQWHTDRASISPLVLEALFACAGRMSEDPAQGAQWLALASRHEGCFLDTPRLSTVQGLLLLLKARESAPKKGYYYRSWMTVKTAVSMAKDLDLHEHYGLHEDGRACGFDPIECLTKTRVWQTLLVCEMMVGGAQGRSDMGVDPDTVDIRLRPNFADMDEFELQISRQYAYFVRNARNIRLIGDSYHKVKKQKDWGADPRFVSNNVLFTKWPEDLPPDLQVTYPLNGSPPWIPSHFVGNLHSHFHLGVIMLQRPQLLASKSFAADEPWKQHMVLCYGSAKHLCRLQEAIIRSFGLTGLLCMQRGINFAIYAVLTCTMLHLLAITCPYPEFYTDARDYFTRHMRILEKCTTAWPLPEMQSHIDSLRVAFSADISKPFELKPTFPYGSPSESYQPSPPLEMQYHLAPYNRHPSQEHQSHLAYATQPITPPISAGHGDPRNSPDISSLGLMPTSHTQAPPTMNNPPMVDGGSWNPTRIFDSWNTAFDTPQSALTAPSNSSAHSSPPMPLSMVSSPPEVPHLQSQYPKQYPQLAAMTSAPQPRPIPQPQHQHQQSYISGAPVFVSPRDWQQSVASAFDPEGLKRRWDYGGTGMDGHMSKRAR